MTCALPVSIWGTLPTSGAGIGEFLNVFHEALNPSIRLSKWGPKILRKINDPKEVPTARDSLQVMKWRWT